MKQRTWSLILLLGVVALGSPAAAQEATLGFEAGVNLATLGFENPDGDVPDTESRTGLRLGAILEYRFDEEGPLGLQTGLVYSQKGTDAVDGTARSTLELDYLEIPMLLSARIPVEGSALYPRLYGGAHLGIELECGIVDRGEETPCEAPAVQTKNVDFGLVVGGGFGWSAGPGEVTVDARYEFGLTNLDDTGPAFDPGFEFRNRVWQLAAGYRFGL